MTTIPELEAEHQQRYDEAEEALVREALEASEWLVQRAARALDVTEPRLRRIVQRHPGLARDLGRRGASRGRPRGPEK